MNNIFNVLLLHGRPASGKSEIIDYIKKTPLEERIARFHIGEIVELDDFPMLWAWFEEDAILEKLGHERLHSGKDTHFKYTHQWDVLIHRLSLEYEKKMADLGDRPAPTILIEFSRGTEHGGYQRAYEHLSENVLSHGSILYVNVTFEESFRKNRKRYNPDKPHSILQHAVDEDILKKLYEFDDFLSLAEKNPDYIESKGIKVPYSIFENMDDVTTGRQDELGQRLEQVLNTLWEKRNRIR